MAPSGPDQQVARDQLLLDLDGRLINTLMEMSKTQLLNGRPMLITSAL